MSQPYAIKFDTIMFTLILINVLEYPLRAFRYWVMNLHYPAPSCHPLEAALVFWSWEKLKPDVPEGGPAQRPLSIH